jgi:prepilin-type N-terminal cleavage/methylation domain-containing protein
MSGSPHARPSARPPKRPFGRGFSLIELVIVVVIIGIIAAIAIPRMSRGSNGAAESALASDLAVLRAAIDLYQTEHQSFPASNAADTAADFQRQLTRYTDTSGQSNAGATADATHSFGPYLRKIPPLPVGSRKGQATVRIGADTDLPGVTSEAWIYYQSSGDIKPNLPDTETDAGGTAYNLY